MFEFQNCLITDEGYKFLKVGNYIEVKLNELESYADGDIGLKRVKGRVKEIVNKKYDDNGSSELFILEINPVTDVTILLRNVVEIKKVRVS